MIRKIIQIDEEACNGCGACAAACHEGAIAMVNGKARLLKDDYCDGLGDCLPACPTGAITFVEREAAPYDEKAVKARMASPCSAASCKQPEGLCSSSPAESRLAQWPVQIKLAPVNAPYFRNARLLIAADCTAYAYANFHQDFMAGRITLVGCPKLDNVDYSEKLTEILRQNHIKDITIVRMVVPCCGGIEQAVKNALMASGKLIPWQVITISTEGLVLS
ncbi:MAG: 4Fe-4S binding protein [Lachnospiraceae bacterium]|jgi:ferredoxin|nr:4Fe-4S binding protein [Lachnospiraceae bacterium]